MTPPPTPAGLAELAREADRLGGLLARLEGRLTRCVAEDPSLALAREVPAIDCARQGLEDMARPFADWARALGVDDDPLGSGTPSRAAQRRIVDVAASEMPPGRDDGPDVELF